MQKKILITRPLFPDIVERLTKSFDVVINEGERYSREQLRTALKDMDGVLVAGGEKIDGDLLEGLTRLKVVSVSSAGYNNVDVPALTRLGIIATNSPGPADETVADFTWGSMIAVARRITEAERWVQEGMWKGSAGKRFFGTDLSGKILGIIGMGRIGQAIARRAAGFRMQVVYHNRRRLDRSIEEECRAAYLSGEELLGKSDFVVLALPYAPGNHHIIGEGELRLMKPSSLLFNIARGGLIDEAALAGALHRRQIAGAGLDVFEEEPVIHPGLKGLPNVLLTPHIAGATEGAQHGLASLAADNLLVALDPGAGAGRPPGILNPEVLGR